MIDVAAADLELEPLLYVAGQAYETKTKTKFPHPSYPQAELSGDEWREDEAALQAKFPRLFSKFWELGPEQAPGSKAEDFIQAVNLLKELIGKTKLGASPAEALYLRAVIVAMPETPEHLAKSAALLT